MIHMLILMEQNIIYASWETEGRILIQQKNSIGTMAVCIPFRIGLKYSINQNINVFAEVGYRFTTTDYLDDVSTNYAGASAFILTHPRWYAGSIKPGILSAGSQLRNR